VNSNVRIAGVTQLSHQFDYVVDRLPLEQASVCVLSLSLVRKIPPVPRVV
jgi:hypothetical protein